MVYDLFRAVGLAPVCDLVRGVTRAVTTSVAGSKAGRQVNRTIDNVLGGAPSMTRTRQIQVQLIAAQVQRSAEPGAQAQAAPTSKGTSWYRVDRHLGGVAEDAVGLAGNVTGRVVGCTYQGLMRGLRLQGNAGCDPGEQGRSYEQAARSMVQCSLLECARDLAISAVTGGTATIAYKTAKTYRKARKARKAEKASEDQTKLLGPGTSYGPKIEKQLAKRGWTKDLVESTIDSPSRRVPWRDTRNLPGGGRMDDPAMGYYSRRGGYVVRNERTGDIVQVSNRRDPGWKAPWD